MQIQERKISMEEYHQKCLAKRKAMMSDIPDVNKNKRVSMYNLTMIKNNPLDILENIKKSLCKIISVKNNGIQIKNKEKFQESLESLRYFTFAVNTIVDSTA